MASPKRVPLKWWFQLPRLAGDFPGRLVRPPVDALQQPPIETRVSGMSLADSASRAGRRYADGRSLYGHGRLQRSVLITADILLEPHRCDLHGKIAGPKALKKAPERTAVEVAGRF